MRSRRNPTGTVAPRVRALVVLAVVAVGLAAATTATATGVFHPTTVRENPVDYTPRLVPDGGTLPRANAIARSGSRMFVGGVFGTVADGTGGREFDRGNFVIFDRRTGAVSTDAPRFNGDVWAVESFAGGARRAVFVGGSFTSVDGVTRPRLVKLDAATGQVLTAFSPRIPDGRVMDLHMYRGQAGPLLFVAGSFGRRLMSLDPVTGSRTGYLDLDVHTEIPNASGAASVNNFAINPAGTRLVAVGNFTRVGDARRARAFSADLGPRRATLSPWYYEPFAEHCIVTRPRRLAYLTDVDFSPNGRYFVVVATGGAPERGDHGKTVCDAAARFNSDGPNRPVRPQWINYTGGDTIWSVAVTGAAVYVQGHFQWLDNFGGSRDRTNPGAVPRLGVGAIHPVTGKALPWAPERPARQGGRQLLPTRDGLWVVSDSPRFNREPRHGIVFVRLP